MNRHSREGGNPETGGPSYECHAIPSRHLACKGSYAKVSERGNLAIPASRHRLSQASLLRNSPCAPMVRRKCAAPVAVPA